MGVLRSAVLVVLVAVLVVAQPAAVSGQTSYAYTFREQPLAYGSASVPVYVEWLVGAEALYDPYPSMTLKLQKRYTPLYRVEIWAAQWNEAFSWWDKVGSPTHSVDFTATSGDGCFANTTILPPLTGRPSSYIGKITRLSTFDADAGCQPDRVAGLPTNALGNAHYRATTTNVGALVYSSGFMTHDPEPVCCSTARTGEWTNSYSYTPAIDSPANQPTPTPSPTPSPTPIPSPTPTVGPATPTPVPPTAVPTPVPTVGPGHSWIDNLPSVASPLQTVAANVGQMKDAVVNFPQTLAAEVTNQLVPNATLLQEETDLTRVEVEARLAPLTVAKDVATGLHDALVDGDCATWPGITFTLPGAYIGGTHTMLSEFPAYWCTPWRDIAGAIISIGNVFYVGRRIVRMFGGGGGTQ